MSAALFPAPDLETDERLARLAALRARMRAAAADVAIVDQQEHVAYLTGFVPMGAYYQCCVVPADGEPFAVVRALDVPTLREQAPGVEHVAYGDGDDSASAVAGALRERGWDGTRIGLERDSNYLTVAMHDALRDRLPDARFVDLAGVLWELRLRKSAAELAHHRRAARIAELMLAAAVAAAGPGRSEREVAAAIYAAGLRAGADNAVMALLVAGDRTEALHGTLGAGPLEEGTLLHLELMPASGGYSSRCMRPVAIGEPPAEAVEVTRRLVAIQDRQLAAMAPGAPAREVDRTARAALRAEGLDPGGTTTGYTLGLIGGARSADHTRNFLPTSDWTLEQSMVFHMFLSARGVTVSDTVVIAADGAERLTCAERRLFRAGERVETEKGEERER